MLRWSSGDKPFKEPILVTQSQMEAFTGTRTLAAIATPPTWTYSMCYQYRSEPANQMSG